MLIDEAWVAACRYHCFVRQTARRGGSDKGKPQRLYKGTVTKALNIYMSGLPEGKRAVGLEGW